MFMGIWGVAVFLGVFGLVGLPTGDPPGRLEEAVIAQVNDAFIFLSDLRRGEAMLRQQLMLQVVPEQRPTVLQEMQRRLLEQLIEQQLIRQKAKELGVDPDAQLPAVLERIKQENNMTSDEELRQALAQQGIAYEDFIETLRYQIMRQQVILQYVQPRIVITENELRAYYTTHRDEFRTPARMQFYQLQAPRTPEWRSRIEQEVLSSPPSADMEEKVASWEEVQFIAIGPIEMTQLREEIRSILEDAPLHRWLGPIELEGRWAWLWLETREGGTVPPFESVRDRIYEKLWSQRADELQKKFIEELKKNSYIRIYLHNLPEPYRSLYQNSPYAAVSPESSV